MRETSSIPLALPALHSVVAGMGQLAYGANGDSRIIEWNTGSETCIYYSYIAGEGDWARKQFRDIDLQALVMRGVPNRTAEVLQSAEELLCLYESMWGRYEFDRLSVACPPTSVSGNCARSSGPPVEMKETDSSAIMCWALNLFRMNWQTASTKAH